MKCGAKLFARTVCSKRGGRETDLPTPCENMLAVRGSSARELRKQTNGKRSNSIDEV